MTRWFQAATAWATIALMLMLPACGGGGSTQVGYIRLLNASAGYAALDFHVDDALKSSALAYGSAGDYIAASDDGVDTVIANAGSALALSSAALKPNRGAYYTMVAYGWQGALKTTLLEDNGSTPASGKSALRVLNTAVDAGSVDVYLTGSTDLLDGATPVAAGVVGGGEQAFKTLGSGTYRLRITGADDKADLRLDITGLTLASQQVATLIVTPGSGGVLTNALLVGQKGGVTALTNTGSRARVVAALSGNAVVTASLGGVVLISGGVAPAVGSYAQVASSSQAMVLNVNGVPVSVAGHTLTAGADYTLLVWGDQAAPQVSLIADDNRLPSASTNAKIRLVNGTAHTAAALTLTVDFSVQANNVAPGTASAFNNLTGATSARLDVTSPLSSTPIYSSTGVALSAKGVYSVFVLADASAPTTLLRRER